MDTKIFIGFYMGTDKPQSMRGDSNPPALLTTYYGNHSVSASDNLLPKSLIRTLSLAFQSRSLLQLGNRTLSIPYLNYLFTTMSFRLFH